MVTGASRETLAIVYGGGAFRVGYHPLLVVPFGPEGGYGRSRNSSLGPAALNGRQRSKRIEAATNT
jgi:hypothetical protein